MNCLNQVGVAREGLQRSRLINPEEHGQIVLLGIQSRELEPGERVFEVSLDPLNRVQLWTIGRQEHEAHIRWEGEPLGCMRHTIVQLQEIQAVREGLGKGVDEELEVVRVRVRQCQEVALARRGRQGTIDVEPCEDVLDRANGLHATGGETASADCQ